MPVKFTVSVRDLAEFCLQEGSLKGGWGQSVDPVHAIFIHQTIQNSRPEEYSSEVSISRKYTRNGIDLSVQGRIDGLYEYPSKIILEEIKTTLSDLKSLEKNDNPVHWGQVKCYAALIMDEYPDCSLETQLVYAHGVSGAARTFTQSFDREELSLFIQRLVDEYTAHLRKRMEWWHERDTSIRHLSFPFPEYREGQEVLVEETSQTIRDKHQLLVQAPTGIGKTMSVMFGALSQIGRGGIDRILYLTGRNTGQNSARTALGVLREKGLNLKSLSLTAKEKLCPCREIYCRPEDCRYAQGFFDRIRPALQEAVEHDHIDEQEIRRLSEKHTVCPFEFSLDASEYADCVIGDYNYMFDPRVSIARLCTGPGKRSAALVDEAHNLVDRSRDMYSSTLEREMLTSALEAAPEKAAGVKEQIQRVRSWLDKHIARVKAEQMCVEDEPPEGVSSVLGSLIQAAHGYFIKEDPAAIPAELQDLFWDCMGFLKTLGRFGKEYRTIFNPGPESPGIRLFCIDPSPWLTEKLEMLTSAVFFSATLSPLEYHRNSFGCETDAVMFALPSPFPPENLNVINLESVSTLYRNRAETRRHVAAALSYVVRAREGNYLFFFPSYEYMNTIADDFRKMNPEVRTEVQTPGLSASQRQDFLNLFNTRHGQSLAGFAVMGGIFGEGIDLAGERLIGAGIVSLGLPGLSAERELIRQYYEELSGEGFEYAFLFPGITRVLQAAGRVIRSETDKGVLLLVDQRYSREQVADLLPGTWNVRGIESREELVAELEGFWHSEPHGSGSEYSNQ